MGLSAGLAGTQLSVTKGEKASLKARVPHPVLRHSQVRFLGRTGDGTAPSRPLKLQSTSRSFPRLPAEGTVPQD